MQQNSSKKPITVKSTTQTIAIIGMLIALGVICSMPFPYGLTVRIGNDLKFSFAFIVYVMAARKYGIFATMGVAAAIDILQTLLSGYGLNVNPFILAGNVFVGLAFGLAFKKDMTIPRLLVLLTVTTVVSTIILTTLGLVLMYSTPLFPLMWFRCLQAVIMFVLQFAVIYLLFIKTDILKRIKFVK